MVVKYQTIVCFVDKNFIIVHLNVRCILKKGNHIIKCYKLNSFDILEGSTRDSFTCMDMSVSKSDDSLSCTCFAKVCTFT